MTALDLARTLLQIVGLGAVVIALGLAWIAWRDRRDRRRYLESERDLREDGGP